MLDLGPHVFDQVVDAGLLEPRDFHKLNIIFPLGPPRFPVGICYAISCISESSDSVVNGTLGDFFGINILQQ